MKNFFIAFLIFLLWSVFGLWVYSVVASPLTAEKTTKSVSEIRDNSIPNKEKQLIASKIIETPPVKKSKNLVIQTLDNELLFESDQTLSVIKDSTKVNLPDSLQELPSVLTSYLNEHPGQEIHIISYFNETLNGEGSNFAEMRGEEVKSLLLAEGADKNQLVVQPVLTTTGFDADNKLENGISFSFKLLDRVRIANYKKEIPEVITFYPTYNFDEVIADKKLTQFTDNVAMLIEENPDLDITIVGHTDHIGAASENYIRGLKSSRQIKWYLINKKGIDRSKINAISKGELEPILRDGRPASRAENARIEIKFSEKV